MDTDVVFENTLNFLSSLLQAFSDPSFMWSVFCSIVYLLMGIFLSLPLALTLGVLAGRRKRLDNVLMPLSLALTSSPGFIFGPILIIMLGPSPLTVILTTATGAFFPQFELIRSGVREIPKRLFEIAQSFGAGNQQVITKVIVPPTLPRMVESFRICLSTLWDSVLATEILANVMGLGSFILATTKTVDARYVIAGVITIILVTILIDRIVVCRVEERIARWK
jgi:ABC-type nitrate/sulfonate/bicarbonate transport system permease component